MNDRSGCLGGFLKLMLLDKLFDFLQSRFGFGRGCSFSGCGCGLILLLVFLAISCSVFTGTDWTRFGF